MSNKTSTALPPYFKFPLIAIAIMTGVKLTFYNLGVDMQTSSNYQIFIHMGLIILSIFFTLHALDQDPNREAHFIDDAKDGFKAGAVYALLATGLVVFYYNVVDTVFFAEMQQRIYERSLGEESDLTEEEQREKIKSFFNLSNWTLATMTGYLALAIVYALLIALFMKVLRQVRRKGL
jgi:hypothetical protein